MILYHAPTSPFVRKVLIVAHETGQFDALTLRTVAPGPLALEPAVARDNPLSKIPVLVTKAGARLHDSAVIAEYLCRRAGDTALLPLDGDARWQVLTLQSLGDGIAEAALLMRFEAALRPPEFHWPDWFAGQRAKVVSALQHLEADGAARGWTLGDIALACALGYLDLRHPEFDWRAEAPRLADWHAGIAARPAYIATAPN